MRRGKGRGGVRPTGRAPLLPPPSPLPPHSLPPPPRALHSGVGGARPTPTSSPFPASWPPGAIVIGAAVAMPSWSPSPPPRLAARPLPPPVDTLAPTRPSPPHGGVWPCILPIAPVISTALGATANAGRPGQRRKKRPRTRKGGGGAVTGEHPPPDGDGGDGSSHLPQAPPLLPLAPVAKVHGRRRQATEPPPQPGRSGADAGRGSGTPAMAPQTLCSNAGSSSCPLAPPTQTDCPHPPPRPRPTTTTIRW